MFYFLKRRNLDELNSYKVLILLNSCYFNSKQIY